MAVRLRQVVIAARDLEAAVAALTGIFGVEVSLRDRVSPSSDW
jgi:hypothetical protein